MAFRKNKPGCPCCDCTCPDDGPSYPKFSTIRIVISGLDASYDYYNESQWDFGQVQTHDGTVTGLDAANGTFLIREELEATMNAGCIVDGEESYPIAVYEEEFTLYDTATRTRYYNFDCDPAVPAAPFDPVVETINYDRPFYLRVTKEGAHWYKVRLIGTGAGLGTGGEGGMKLTGCQVFACENNFDAATDGTLSDDQKEHGLGFDEAEAELCSDGDIWFSPFSFSTNATSTVCGVSRVFADMEIVGTIVATLE
jgi:hypothetical protein